MTRPHGKWPHYAEWGRLDAICAFGAIDKAAQSAQDAIRHGRTLEAALTLGDIIRKSAEGRRTLESAKNGDHDANES